MNQDDGSLLPIGTRVDQYDIIGHLGHGGFGITYKVHDPKLDTVLALKEFFPANLVVRQGQGLRHAGHGKSAADYEWSRRKYGETFLETKALAARLESELPGDYDFYEWGNETGLYFYSKRSPPIGLFYVSPVFVRPSLLERVADPLARRPPHVVVVERTWPPPARVEDWLASNYALAARVPGAGGFELWTRR